MSDRYRIVYQKVEDALKSEPSAFGQVELAEQELDEIDELRRLACELSNPEPASYTTT